MKRKIISLLTVLFLLLPVAGVQAKDNTSMKGMDHSGMNMSGKTIMLEADTRDNIKGVAHLRDISKTMAEMGMDKTHHFMVIFTEVKTGKTITAGIVALIVVDPAGKKRDVVRMMAMDGSFGADVSLAQKGKFVFEVGTKLDNGKTRQFKFNYTVE
jgi:hypothetical protein